MVNSEWIFASKEPDIYLYSLVWSCHWWPSGVNVSAGPTDPNISAELQVKMLRRRVGRSGCPGGALVAMTLEAAWEDQRPSCWWAMGGRISCLGEPCTGTPELPFLSLSVGFGPHSSFPCTPHEVTVLGTHIPV